jgi:hypothetical protein
MIQTNGPGISMHRIIKTTSRAVGQDQIADAGRKKKSAGAAGAGKPAWLPQPSIPQKAD